MNRLWTASRDVEAFLANPKRHPMLQERYYGLEISNDRLVALRSKLYRCLENLYRSPTWDDVCDAEPGSILLLPPTEPFLIAQERVYAAPDLAFKCQGGGWTFVDWKTGSLDGVEAQFGVYSLVLHEAFEVPIPMTGRVVNLDSGDEYDVQMTGDDLAKARTAIGDGVYRMRGMVVDMDTDRNEAQPLERFPFPVNTEGCRWCNFFEVCGPALEEAEYLGPF